MRMYVHAHAEPIYAHAGRRAFFSIRPYPREGCVRNNFPPAAAEEKADVFKKEKDFFTLAQPLCMCVDLGQLVARNLKSHLIYFLITFHSCGATAADPFYC